MHKEVEKYLRVKRKLIVLEYARVFGSNLEAYKAYGIPKSTFYDWKKAFEEEGEEGLAYKKPICVSSQFSITLDYFNVILFGSKHDYPPAKLHTQSSTAPSFLQKLQDSLLQHFSPH